MELKSAASSALGVLLRPIVRLLLELGVSVKDFNEIAKQVYVDVASSEYGIRNRPTNASRVAILTGLSRREVARVRDTLQGDPPEFSDESTVLGRVLSGWHQDDAFTTNGVPDELPAGGPRSLTALLERYAPDVPPTAVLKELNRVGAIEIGADGSARALMRYYMPLELDAASVERYGSVLSDLASTINHNVLDTEVRRRRFEGRAVNPRLGRADLDEFRGWLAERGQWFLEEVDAWLTAHELANDATEPALRIGAGLYFIADDTSSKV
jgi:hypothetical protein